MDRLPASLRTASAFLIGASVGVLVKDAAIAIASGVAGLAMGAVSVGLQTQWARRRWPQLAPKRSRLSRLHSDVTEIRSSLKRTNAKGTVDIGEWEPRIREFDTAFWRRLAAIEPDDWRREKLKIIDFELVNRGGGAEPAKWAAQMLGHLQRLRTLTEERMDKYPLT